MRTELSREGRRSWRALFEAHALMLRKIDDDLAAEGVGALTDYDVLFLLYEAPQRRLRMAELADAVMISRSGLTRLVDRLEKKGFLYREPAPDDRRGAFAVLKDSGVEEMRRIWGIYARGIHEYFAAHLTEEETEQVRCIFGRLRDRMRGKLECPLTQSLENPPVADADFVK
jgi:DNA-binding MarR family transcriptional regulator